MIEPEVTAALGRRFLAFLIDVSLVVATGLGVAFRQTESFAVIGRDPDGKALVDPANFETIRSLLDFELLGQTEVLGVPLARLQEFGDSVYVFGSSSYTSGLLAALAAALVVFGLIPMIIGRTLGMVPFGLGVLSADGSKAGVGAHLTRTLAGFIDAIPFALPGLLGFLAASRSPLRQRIGDRLAKTVVVDLEAHRTSSGPNEAVELRLQPPAQPVDASADLGGPGDAELDGEALPTPASADAATPPVPNEPVADTSVPVTPTSIRPSPAEALAQAEAAATQRDRATASTADTPHADSLTSTAPSAADSASEDAVRAKRNDALPPPPVHRKAPSERPLGTHGTVDSSPALDDVEPDFAKASELEAPTASPDRHLSAQPSLPLDLGEERNAEIERPDRTWQPPREEVAPVWQPARLEPAPREAPKPNDGRSLDDLDTIEPSIGALLADQADDDDRSSADTGASSAKKGSAKAPVWSEKWRAWMYWDPAKKCWLRHDTETNNWIPVA